MKSENQGTILGSGPRLPVAQPSPLTTTIKCPQCGNQSVWKDGIRYTIFGEIQRYLCRNCYYRFSHSEGSEPSERLQKLHTLILKSKADKDIRCRVSAAQTKGAKNLAKEETRTQEKAAGATETQLMDVKGKIIECLWWMEKQGYAKDTIRGYGSCLRALLARNADLSDPETVKEALAREKKWSQNRKRNAINAYSLFLKVNGMHWEKPKCKVARKLPFIPAEQELDALIAGCGNKTATFLQLLKETAMRSGEAKRLLWTDFDPERRLITLNFPEKGGNPRIWRVSGKLTGMLNALPKKSLKVFGDGPINSMKTTFLRARKRIATKLQNPRLLQISFHTFRHWKATMYYHETKNPLLVKELLGHQKLDTTLLYIQIEQAMYTETDDKFTVMAVKSPEELKKLLEVGFEYVCQKDDLTFLRKRK